MEMGVLILAHVIWHLTKQELLTTTLSRGSGPGPHDLLGLEASAW